MYIFLGIIVLFIAWAIYSYNSFVRLVNRSKEAWSDIEVQLKRRYDLIPNLINTVKGYAKQESSVFENVTRARAHAMAGGNNINRDASEKALSAGLSGIFAIAEAYPELKSNQNFLALQTELSDTENKIQSSRRFYNSNVRDLNTSIESFPGNIIAREFGFPKMDLFGLDEADSAAKNPVEVKF